MKKLTLFLLWATMLCLAGCWSSYDLDIQSDNITWEPHLKANMQVISFNEDNVADIPNILIENDFASEFLEKLEEIIIDDYEF